MGNFISLHEAIDHVNISLNKARNGKSNLLLKSKNNANVGDQILNIFGMSGKKWRHFLNNLMSKKEINYLEIGSHTGSTFCSALYMNPGIGYAQTIDNWSEFGNKKETLVKNTANTVVSSGIEGKKVRVSESDFYDYDYSILPKIDVYLFDGPHREQYQYDGVKIVFDQLADIFILLVDDWNWGGPRRGTEKALRELDIRVVYQCEIYTEAERFDSKTGKLSNRFQLSDWHNGVAIFVCEKINQQS